MKLIQLNEYDYYAEYGSGEDGWEDYHTIKTGQILYHGTSGDFHGEDLQYPAWFSDNKDVAHRFSSWNGESRYIFIFEVTEDISVPEISSEHELSDFMEVCGGTMGSPQEMADTVQSAGYDGWVIPGNYGYGDDIMLTNGYKIRLIETIDLRTNELTEAPIQDIDFGGDMDPTDDTGSFRQQDVKAMKNPKWQTKVISLFKKNPYDINLYFFNAPEGKVDVRFPEVFDDVKELRHGGIHDFDVLKRIMGKTPPRAESSISVLLMSNEAGQRIALTPWMVAHRMAHAIFEGGDNAANWFNTANFQSLTSESIQLTQMFFRKMILRLEDYKGYEDIENMAGYYGTGVSDPNLITYLVGTFKSARDANVRDMGEWIVETFTQYIIDGKVTFKIPKLEPSEMFQQEIELNPGQDRMGRLGKTIKELETQYNELYGRLMKECVGKLFVL